MYKTDTPYDWDSIFSDVKIISHRSLTDKHETPEGYVYLGLDHDEEGWHDAYGKLTELAHGLIDRHMCEGKCGNMDLIYWSRSDQFMAIAGDAMCIAQMGVWLADVPSEYARFCGNIDSHPSYIVS